MDLYVIGVVELAEFWVPVRLSQSRRSGSGTYLALESQLSGWYLKSHPLHDMWLGRSVGVRRATAQRPLRMTFYQL